MTNKFRNIAVAALFGAALAGCGGGGNDSSPPPPAPVVVPPAPTPKIEDSFGTGFATAYRNDMNTDGRDPAAGDLPPLSLTTEATPI